MSDQIRKWKWKSLLTRSRFWPWLKTNYLELALGLINCIAAFGLAWLRIVSLPENTDKWIVIANNGLLGLSIAALLLFFGQCYKKWREVGADPKLKQLECALEVAYALLSDSDASVRMTCLVKGHGLWRGEYFEQVVPYAGPVDKSDHHAGRTWSVEKGICGHAFTLPTAKIVRASRVGLSWEEYIEELVGQWHYSEKEAQSLTRDTMSWLVVPVEICPITGKTLAVLYVDSKKQDYFTDQNRNDFLSVAVGLAYHFQGGMGAILERNLRQV